MQRAAYSTQTRANPVAMVADIFGDEKVLNTCASAGMGLLTEEGRDLFKHWVINQWFLAAQDPETNRRMRAANQAAAVFDVANFTQKIPLVGFAIPNPERLYLPAEIIATAAWSLKLRDLHNEIKKKTAEHARSKGWAKHVEVVWDQSGSRAIKNTKETLPMVSPRSLGLSQSWKGAATSLALTTVLGLSLGQSPTKALCEGTASYAEQQVRRVWNRLDLDSEEAAWTHHLMLLGLTSGFVGDPESRKWARWHALFTMVENFEMLQKEAPHLIGQVIEYWQQQDKTGRLLGLEAFRHLTIEQVKKGVKAFNAHVERIPLPDPVKLTEEEKEEIKVRFAAQPLPPVEKPSVVSQKSFKSSPLPLFGAGMFSFWVFRKVGLRLVNVTARAA